MKEEFARRTVLPLGSVVVLTISLAVSLTGFSVRVSAVPPDLVQAERLYKAFCSRCHGIHGEGGEGAALNDAQWLHGGRSDEVRQTVTEGVAEKGMQKFGGKLTDAEIQDVVAYVMTLSGGTLASTNPVSAASGTDGGSPPPALEETVLDATWAPTMTGRAEEGEALFFDAAAPATCGTCHVVNGRGGKVGPDLTGIATRQPPAYLVRAVLQPHADIADGYGAVMVMTKTGQYLTGVIQEDQGSRVSLATAEGTVLRLRRAEIDRLETMEVSLMPGNYADLLTVQQLYDLLAYLRTLR